MVGRMQWSRWGKEEEALDGGEKLAGFFLLASGSTIGRVALPKEIHKNIAVTS